MMPVLDNTTIQAGPGKIIKAREGTSVELNSFNEVNTEDKDTETVLRVLASIDLEAVIKATDGSTLEPSVNFTKPCETDADFEDIVGAGDGAVEVQGEGDDTNGPNHTKPLLRVQTAHATRVRVEEPSTIGTQLPDIDTRFLSYRTSPLDAPSPSDVSSPAPSPFSDLSTSSPISPSPPLGETITSSVSPSPTRNQTRRGRIAGDKPYIPRPRNSFLLFREEYHKTQATPDLQRAQPHLSKIAGEKWKAMSLAERRPYEEMAKKEKEEHSKKYPGYVYSPSSTKKSRAKATAGEKKTRIREPRPLPQGSVPTWNWRRLLADTKVLDQPPELVASSAEWDMFTPLDVIPGSNHSVVHQPVISAPPQFQLDPRPLNLRPPFEFRTPFECHRPGAPPSTATYAYPAPSRWKCANLNNSPPFTIEHPPNLHLPMDLDPSTYLQPHPGTVTYGQRPSDYSDTEFANTQLQAQVIGGSVNVPPANFTNLNQDGYSSTSLLSSFAFNHPHSNNIPIPLYSQHFDSLNFNRGSNLGLSDIPHYASDAVHGVIPNGLSYANNDGMLMPSFPF